MEQNYDILQNRFFTGTSTNSAGSNLEYANNYYLNKTNQTEKVVDFSNIRAFLANENNQKVVKAYYSFLSSSTVMNSALIANPQTTSFVPTSEFKAIYYDDEKLADSFNEFYNSSILRGLNSKYSANPDIFNNSIRNQLLNDGNSKYTPQDVSHNYYFWQSSNSIKPANSPKKTPFSNAVLDIKDGDRDISLEKKLVNVPVDGEYYFINVFLTKRFTQTARISFEVCSSSIYKFLKGSSTYSQNSTDIVKYNDYLSNSEVVAKNANFDGSLIKTPGVESVPTTQNSGTNNTILISKPQLIQCFVNPNFITNQNVYWTDSRLISKSGQTIPVPITGETIT